MSKTYLIETRQSFIIGYAVVMDDDMDPRMIAGKIIADRESSKELYQFDIGEIFEQCIPLQEGQAARVYRAKSVHPQDLSDAEIVKKFTMDFRTNKEEDEKEC